MIDLDEHMLTNWMHPWRDQKALLLLLIAFLRLVHNLNNWNHTLCHVILYRFKRSVPLFKGSLLVCSLDHKSLFTEGTCKELSGRLYFLRRSLSRWDLWSTGSNKPFLMAEPTTSCTSGQNSSCLLKLASIFFNFFNLVSNIFSDEE